MGAGYDGLEAENVRVVVAEHVEEAEHDDNNRHDNVRAIHEDNHIQLRGHPNSKGHNKNHTSHNTQLAQAGQQPLL